jgi:maintenance of morphology protein 1
MTEITPQLIDSLKHQLTEISCSKTGTYSFMKGFILGQLSVIILVALVLRYLFTEDVKNVKKVSSFFFFF